MALKYIRAVAILTAFRLQTPVRLAEPKLYLADDDSPFLPPSAPSRHQSALGLCKFACPRDLTEVESYSIGPFATGLFL